MTPKQEDALYDFLMDKIGPFSLKEVTSAVRAEDSSNFGKLSTEITRLITMHRFAFEISANRWITRAGYFTGSKFVIRPTQDELINGIIIPGHRFVPFANPLLLQKEYKCYWNEELIPFSDTEAVPEELYPYYTVFGEEFAPELIARENIENEEAFNSDPYEDPLEVSIKTLDMRVIYRESGFIPGDKIIVTLRDWKNGIFEFKHIRKDAWGDTELNEWLYCAEEAFKLSFNKIGPHCTTEEQIAWAYYLGGERMCNTPAYSLEDFLFEKTDKIEYVPFGIESRFWFAGKEIPDYIKLRGVQTQSNQTPIEKILFENNVPISEFVIQSYVYDAFYRKDTDVSVILERIVPKSVRMRRWNTEIVMKYIFDTFREFRETYSVFTDKKTGPLRRSAGELHTAAIDLAARLENGDIDHTWLPKHSFVILSQLQNHAAAILEDLPACDDIPDTELTAIENSLESMLDTYEDIKDMIEKSLDNYRRSNITLVRKDTTEDNIWRTVQIGIGGTGVWRRFVVPESFQLVELHKLIQAVLGWTEIFPYRFIFEHKTDADFIDTDNNIKETLSISDLAFHGFSEITYEYGPRWSVKVLILAVYTAGKDEHIRCIAGECSPPHEKIEGPLRFRRFISALDSNIEEERATARMHLGPNFKSDFFDINSDNKQIENIKKL